MKTRQRKHELVKGGVLVVGVDIGKFKHFAAFRVSGLVVKTVGFENDLAGFERLARDGIGQIAEMNRSRARERQDEGGK